MTTFDALTMIQTIVSVISLAVSLFVASKVISIESRIRVDGDNNVTAGRDVNVK